MTISLFSDHLLDGTHAARPAATTVPEGALYACTDHNLIYQSDGTTWSIWATLGDVAGAEPEALMIAVSDETTALSVGTAKVTFRMPFAMTLTAVRASLTSASSAAGPVTVDINEGGASILSTKLTIDDTEKTSVTAAAAAVISDAALADDAELTIDIDTAGTGAKGLKVTLIGTRT